ncbi:hypothetical protein AB4084_28810, partial [Lysobacter sp. 2RAB21]
MNPLSDSRPGLPEGSRSGCDADDVITAPAIDLTASPNQTATAVTPPRINKFEFLRYLAHPILLSSVVIYSVTAITLKWNLGAASMAYVLATIVYLAGLERLDPQTGARELI